jgi:Uma2 family endonuclease
MSYSDVLEEHYTVEEFAEMEMTTPHSERWELIRGRIWRNMTGGTVAHNQLTQNIAFALRSKLRQIGSPCRVFSENVKFEESLQESAVYPDVIVTCERVKNDALKIVAPVILVEVVSRSSALRDRREKLGIYANTPSLRSYLVVEQEKAIVEFWSRPEGVEDGSWTAKRFEGLKAELAFPEFGFAIAMAEIYERVLDA